MLDKSHIGNKAIMKISMKSGKVRFPVLPRKFRIRKVHTGNKEQKTLNQL